MLCLKGSAYFWQNRTGLMVLTAKYKNKTSRLVHIFASQFKAWANKLDSMNATTLAISRKGPRLIELLIYEGLLPDTFRKRVISELALPFMQDCHGDLIIIDDSVSNGTTFNKIYDLSKEAATQWKSFNKIVGLPFAVGEKVQEKCLKKLDYYFLRLKKNEIAAFVNSEAFAFQLLGKPFDLEHPILTVTGDFTNTDELETVLEKIASTLKGKVIPLNTQVSTADGVIESKSWTVTFNRDSHTNQSIAQPEFKKVRVYLNQNRDKLSIAAMQPIVLSDDSFANLEQAFPDVFKVLWKTAYDTVIRTFPRDKSSKSLNDASSRSLCMWANFLNSMLLLVSFKKEFLREMAEIKKNLDWSAPNQDDLRLLVGNNLAEQFEILLKEILENGSEIKISENIFLDKLREEVSIKKGEKIPEKYQPQYEKRLEYLRSIEDVSVDDVLRTIFYSQHIIEVLSREEQLDEERLDFGLTYRHLLKVIREYVSESKEEVINFCFDRLVDEGCIVPRYINMNDSGETNAIWVRAFRVGEATAPKIDYVVELLFDNLNRLYNNDGTIPEFLLEKYCVLVLLSEHRDLCSITDLLNGHSHNNLKKDFDVKGARCVINPSGKKDDFLLEWAVRRKVLLKNNNGYQLDTSLPSRINPDDAPFDTYQQYAIEDMASLVCFISNNQNIGEPALTLLTSTASQRELQIAVEEELRLWIYDDNSIEFCINSLKRILNTNSYTPEYLIEARNGIDKLLMLISEAKNKQQIYQKKEEIFSNIDTELQPQASQNQAMIRMWNDLKTILNNRLSEDHKFQENEPIKFILSLADKTNKVLDNFLKTLESQENTNTTANTSFYNSVNLLAQFLQNPTTSNVIVSNMSFEDNITNVNCLSFILAKINVISPTESSQTKEHFISLEPAFLKIKELCEKVWRCYSYKPDRATKSNANTEYKYIIKWDKIASTYCNPTDLATHIAIANRNIMLLGSHVEQFNDRSLDDGNSFVCNDFSTVMAAFNIITTEFQRMSGGHRFGCHYCKVNSFNAVEGLQYSTRIMDLFKEIQLDQNRWSGGILPQLPTGNYLVISESARTQAEEDGTWRLDSLQLNSPQGRYKPRLDNGRAPSFPVSIIFSQTTQTE